MKKKLLFSSCLLAALAFPATISADDLGPKTSLNFKVDGTALSNVTVTAQSEGNDNVTATLSSVKYGTTDKALLRITGNSSVICANQNGNTATAQKPLIYNFTINGLPTGYKIGSIQITTAACNSSGGFQDASQSRKFDVTASIDETPIASWETINISLNAISGLNSWYQEVTNPYTVSTDPVSLTISAYMNGTTDGCFFGIQSIILNCEAPVEEPEPVFFTYNNVNYQIIDEDAKTVKTKPGGNYNDPGNVMGSSGTLNLVIPETVEYEGETYTVTEIGDSSFADGAYTNSCITSVDLPATITRVGAYAFCYTPISEVTIRATTPPTRGSSAFYGITSNYLLVPAESVEAYQDSFGSSWTVSPIGGSAINPNFEYNGIKYTIIDMDLKTLTTKADANVVLSDSSHYSDFVGNNDATGNIIIPEIIPYENEEWTVTEIGYGSFFFSSITSITLPPTVEIINEYAFADCTSLKTVNLNEGLFIIDDYAFYTCDAITELELPSTVEMIGENSFYFCDSLTTLELPASIFTIGGGAFYGVPFQTVTSNAVTPPILEVGDYLTFSEAIKDECTLYVPKGAVEAYSEEGTYQWGYYFSNIQPIGGVEPEPEPEYDINDVVGYYNASFSDYDYNEDNQAGVEISLGNSENSVKIANLLPGLEGYYVVGTFDPYNNTISVAYNWVYQADGTATELVVEGDNQKTPALFKIEDGVITLQDEGLYVYDYYWGDKDDYYSMDMYELVLTKVESVTISISGDDTAIASVTLNGEDVDDFTAIEAAPGDELEITFNEVGSGAALVVTVNDEPVEVKDNACTITVSTVDLDIVVTVDKSVGVNALEENGQEVIYNLQGVRVDRSRLTKGVYIINGKKVMVK